MDRAVVADVGFIAVVGRSPLGSNAELIRRCSREMNVHR